MFRDDLQFGILINLESVFNLRYTVFVHIQAVNNSVMGAKIRAMPWLRNMRDLKLLMRCRRSFSGCGMEHVPGAFPLDGCQYLINGCPQQIGTEITRDASLKIVDTLWTVILGIGRWPCCCLFCLWKLPIRWLCITVTGSLFNERTYNTTNSWRSVDAHLQNGAESVLLSLLRIQIANMSVMHNGDPITVQWPYLQDHKSLTLQWRSFSEWGRDCAVVSFAYKSCQYISYA